ncbi:MAG: Fe-S cluster assembly protein SufD [Chloroflexi bacterium]|nr:Fe-S cluster assembly protein SufD [Chloroflexota bacterium]
MTKYDKYVTAFQSLERSQAAREPQWVRDIRQRALSRFSELGFPTARRGNENWKYTNVGPVANANFEYAFGASRDGEKAIELRGIAPWGQDWVNLVFLNGRYSEVLSTKPSSAYAARVTNLADAFLRDGEVLEKHLARHATFDDDGFTALNTSFLRDGAFIHIPEGESVQAPIHLIFIATGSDRPSASHPRTLIVTGKHSKATIIESYIALSPAPYFNNAVTEIVVGDQAQIEHYRLLLDNTEAFHIGTSQVYQGQDSKFTSTIFAKGAALGRNNIHVLLDAPGSSCVLNGLYMTSGTQHMDNYINIDHAKPHAFSRLNYKGILDGKSRAVFGGIVVVRPGAIKTDARQSDKNLLLSRDAEVNSKPSLLIFADDVKCGHGATAGHIDGDSIFYMRSRGLDIDTASRLLIYGFAREIIDTVQVEPLRVYLEKLFLGALPSFKLLFGERA